MSKISLSPHNTKRMVSGPSCLLYFSLKLSAWAPPLLTVPGLQKEALGGSCGGCPLPDVLCSASPTCCAPYLRYVLGVVLCEAKTKSDLHEVLSVTRRVPSRMPRQRRICFSRRTRPWIPRGGQGSVAPTCSRFTLRTYKLERRERAWLHSMGGP